MLEVSRLSRKFGDLTAVDEVSFAIEPGNMVGFVGGNGAGKTTTMRMMMGLLQPTSGEVFWCGEKIDAATRRQIGYMPEERGLYPKQPVINQLCYLGQLKGMSKTESTQQAMEMLERFGLASRSKDKLEKLSLGNQQRVQIIAALLGDPIALILDEPFSGLDPGAVDEMATLLSEKASQGVPMLFSSHQLDLVERICSKLVVLSAGKVVAYGTHEELISMGKYRFRLVLSGDAGWVREIPGVGECEIFENTAMLGELSAETRRSLLVRGLEVGEVLEFSRVRPTLSEIYREVTA